MGLDNCRCEVPLQGFLTGRKEIKVTARLGEVSPSVKFPTFGGIKIPT